MTDNITLVLESVSPSSLIGSFIKLKPLHNRTFLGLCPFHSEKTPSFRIDDEKKFFYCFGCHKGGNILNFLQEYKKISFVEALDEIAQKYGIKLQKINKKEQDEVISQKTLMEKVADIFALQLKSQVGRSALNYLLQRGFSLKTIEEFKIGFCPKENDFLLSYFPEKIDELLSVGLIGKRDGNGFYSTFNGRIMFPILNLKEEVIAFGGRVFEKYQDGLAKYINSKESEIFKKNRVIYGLEKAKKTKLPLVIVEGYLDVIKMHQHGFKSTVAQMGTAFSEEQINLLFGLSNEIIFCYDADEAGRKAEKRSIEMCLPFLNPERSLFFLSLETKDADEFLDKFGQQKMSQKIAQKIPLYEKIFQIFNQNINFQNPNESAVCENNLMKFCEKITNLIVRKNYQSYFKSKIFSSKSLKKQLKIDSIVDKTEFSVQDLMLFALFLKFPDFFKTDYYFEHFVSFYNEKLQKIVDGKITNEIKLIDEIQAKYPLKEVHSPKEFYDKIYTDFVCQNLQKEKLQALKNNDFTTVKRINEELARLKR